MQMPWWSEHRFMQWRIYIKSTNLTNQPRDIVDNSRANKEQNECDEGNDTLCYFARASNAEKEHAVWVREVVVYASAHSGQNITHT
jgi:hypothetical protein